MGNLNCKSCNCAQFFEKKVELDLKNPVHIPQDNFLNKRANEPANLIGQRSIDYLKPYIPKLEALWQGYTARNFAVHMRRQTKPNHNYFSQSEIRETLSSKVGLSEFRQKKKAFKYKSGGTYTGQWLGGFRDGFGTMIWPDGASYEGNWSYSKPYGFGTFTHVDGDSYEGEWRICYISPKDTFGTGSNLSHWKDMVSDGYRNFYSVWLWIKHETFKTEAPKKRAAKKDLKDQDKGNKIAHEERVNVVHSERSVRDSISEKSREYKEPIDFVSRESVEVKYKAGFDSNKRGNGKRSVNESVRASISEIPKEMRESFQIVPKEVLAVDQFVENEVKVVAVERPKEIKTKETITRKQPQIVMRFKKNSPQKSPVIDLPQEEVIVKKPEVVSPKIIAKKSEILSPEITVEIKEQHQGKLMSSPEPNEEIDILSESNDRFLELKTRVSLIEASLVDVKREILENSGAKNKKLKQKKYDNGNIYIGEFKGPLRDGKGKLIWTGGDVYEGEWAADKQEGKGKITWVNGNYYIGFFYNDEKSGIGEYIWNDQSSYVGEWRYNKMHGIGRYRWTDGREFLGEWTGGSREGLGIMSYKNGSKYEGEFKGGKPNGFGSLTDKSGKLAKGEWKNGKLTEN